MEKRGMSSVVTTLVIILLALVAIGIVWVVVSAIIRSNSDQISLGGFSTTIKIISARIIGENISTSIRRDSGEEQISGISFLLTDGVDYENFTFEVTNFNKLSIQQFILTPVVIDIDNATELSVAPIYYSSTGEKQGDILDTITIGHSITGGTGGENPGDPEDPENPTCTPETPEEICGTQECGSVDSILCEGQSVTCGTCAEGSWCNSSNMCEVGTCIPETPEEICGTQECGSVASINCLGEYIACGTCDTGYFCNSTSNCEFILPMNNGTINEIWPIESVLYFSSLDLPQDTVEAENYSPVASGGPRYVRLNTSLPEAHVCEMLAIYRTPVEGYATSHVGFNTVLEGVLVDQWYAIYENAGKCMNATFPY